MSDPIRDLAYAIEQDKLDTTLRSEPEEADVLGTAEVLRKRLPICVADLLDDELPYHDVQGMLRSVLSRSEACAKCRGRGVRVVGFDGGDRGTGREIIGRCPDCAREAVAS